MSETKQKPKKCSPPRARPDPFVNAVQCRVCGLYEEELEYISKLQEFYPGVVLSPLLTLRSAPRPKSPFVSSHCVLDLLVEIILLYMFFRFHLGFMLHLRSGICLFLSFSINLCLSLCLFSALSSSLSLSILSPPFASLSPHHTRCKKKKRDLSH